MNMTEPPSVTKSMINHITILLISFLQMEEWKQSETTYNLRVECCVRKFPVAIQYLVVDTWTSFIKFIYMISFVSFSNVCGTYFLCNILDVSPE